MMEQRLISMCILCYIPMLEGQTDSILPWLETTPEKYGVTPVLLPAVDWNNDLTPWPAGPIFKKGKSFGGKADAYLRKLTDEIIPSREADLGVQPEERWLVGISLSGLFAVWAAVKGGFFHRIAAISGSFWYKDFTAWLEAQPVSPTVRSAYISLGDKEAESKNPNLKRIAEETETVVRILREKGIPTTFEWTDGTHFAPVAPRIEKALNVLRISQSAH